MPVPNLRHIVQQVRDSRLWDFSTRGGLCAYGRAVVLALHRADSDFGELKKSAGQNHCVDGAGRRVAVDAALYLPTGQAADFIKSAGVGSENAVAWTVQDPVGKYDAEDWLAPYDGSEPPPDKPDEPDLPTDHQHPEVPQLEADVAALYSLHDEVVRQLSAINAAIASLHGRIVELEARPLPPPPRPWWPF